ncbi:MAG: sodium-dependent transporter [Eubacteriales bacterium]|jgi:NSS family neurotransmitter:Na+ symporter|nr:sodium-dependent transporter [Eubacteriales bacterium]MDD3289654.1 sodium-dependent transporter [Eubacteriales bacterium]MDD3863741.1 sodium-dependent transporter [Eubacteriales bacterium]
MPDKKSAGFNSRMGLMMTLIGGSVGTGNIWRFPRMAALNGGGAFVIALIIASFIVALPILNAEMLLGRATRHSGAGAFRDFLGDKYTWMGTFMVSVCMLITAYYMAILGWVFRYIGMSLTGSYLGKDLALVFDRTVNGNLLTYLWFVIPVLVLAVVLYKGIGSIEKVNMFMIPALFLICAILAIRAVTLPGSLEGVKYFFNIDWNYLVIPTTWLNALSQCSWSIGPGFCLTLAYAVYTQPKSDLSLNTSLQVFGNQSFAMLAGLMVLPAVFAMASSPAEAYAACASGNQGLTFITLTGMFQDMPGGRVLSVLFFTGLAFAAFTSAIGMCNVGQTFLMDFGWSRKKAVAGTVLFVLVVGTPSALSLRIFNNQDWVWGVALLLSTIFLGFAMNRYGLEKVRITFLNQPENEWKMGRWWSVCAGWIAPIMTAIMIIWWMAQSIAWFPDDWWDPTNLDGLATVVLQTVLLLALLSVTNRKIARSIKRKYFNGKDFPEIPEEYR